MRRPGRVHLSNPSVVVSGSGTELGRIEKLPRFHLVSDAGAVGVAPTLGGRLDY